MAPDCTCLLVRATTGDLDELSRFNSRFETTRYPVDVLWGPGTAEDARRWLKFNPPDEDEVDHLDRHFMIRHGENRVDPPRRAEVAASLSENERAGIWFLVKADDPLSAYNHGRNIALGDGACSRQGPCYNCAADTVAHGDWAEVLLHAAEAGANTLPRALVDVRVPSLLSSWLDG